MSEKPESAEPTYALGAVSRLTGLSPELLRAWERRYGAVAPLRTPGGTRRYRADDLERLRLIKAAVDAGHRIGSVATLSIEALRTLGQTEAPPTDAALDAVLAAVERLDGDEARRLLSLQLASLGGARFARRCAFPLMRTIGDRWAAGELDIASEHLASGVIRSLLGSALVPASASVQGPRIALATPTGERHELGLLMAALTAMGAGGNPIYLGSEVPVETLLGAAERANVAALAVSIVSVPSSQAERFLAAVRAGLPDRVHVWVGGGGAASLAAIPGVEHIPSLEDLEQRVARLRFEPTASR